MNGFKGKNAGLADWVFILATLGAVIIGNLAVKTTKVIDSPVEQAMEQVIRDTSGRDVDFSANLKRDAQGNVVEQNVVVQKQQSRYVAPSDGKIPAEYRK